MRKYQGRPMFVCICNALKDRELAEASRGANNVSEVFRRCGRRPQCGKCLTDVARMIEEDRQSHQNTALIAAE